MDLLVALSTVMTWDEPVISAILPGSTTPRPICQPKHRRAPGRRAFPRADPSAGGRDGAQAADGRAQVDDLLGNLVEDVAAADGLVEVRGPAALVAVVVRSAAS